MSWQLKDTQTENALALDVSFLMGCSRNGFTNFEFSIPKKLLKLFWKQQIMLETADWCPISNSRLQKTTKRKDFVEIHNT